MPEPIPAELLTVPPGMPVLIERTDGWYVEVIGAGRICSAGPTTRDKAAAMLADVRAAYDKWNRENLN